MLIDKAAASRGSTPDYAAYIPYGDKSIFRDRVDSGGKLPLQRPASEGRGPPFLRIRRAANLVVPGPLSFAKFGVFTILSAEHNFVPPLPGLLRLLI